MPYTATTRDLTSQYLGFDRDIDTFRPQGGITFTPGLAVRLTSQDQQIYPDESTVTLPSTTIGATQNKIMGIVAETWPGFSGSIAPPTYLSPANSTLTRGTIGVDVILRGFAPTILVDQSGAGAVTLVDGLPMVPSVAAAGQGRSQGVATATATGGLGTTAIAMLPVGAYFGSSLTAAALAQAAATFTVAGTPTLGDVYTITCTAPYTTAAPGVAQLFTWVIPPLTTAAAVSATTAAAFIVTYLNSLAPFSTTSGYFIATSALGVVTITVNALATPWQITFGANGVLQNAYNLALSGMIANNASNGLVTTAAVVGVSTFVATTQFTGGTGYKGQVPGYVVPS